MIALLLYLTEQKGGLQLFWPIASFAIMTAALVQNRSLGPYLAVIVGLLCSVVLGIAHNKNLWRRLLIAVVVFCSLSVLMNAFSLGLSQDLRRLFGDIGNILRQTRDAPLAGSGRWKIWVNGLQFASEKPLFGYGPDNLGVRYAAAGINIDRPHNELIQFAASLGLPAVIFYLTALSGHFIGFFRRWRVVSLPLLMVFCALITYLVSSFFGNTMYYTTPYFFLVLGLSGGMLKAVVDEPQVERWMAGVHTEKTEGNPIR